MRRISTVCALGILMMLHSACGRPGSPLFLGFGNSNATGGNEPFGNFGNFSGGEVLDPVDFNEDPGSLQVPTNGQNFNEQIPEFDLPGPQEEDFPRAATLLLPPRTQSRQNDIDGDGFADYAQGAAPGDSDVGVALSSLDYEVVYFHPYDPGFTGGINVAVGRVLGAQYIANVVTAAWTGGGPHMRVYQFDRNRRRFHMIVEFWAYVTAFRGGVNVAVADMDKDGTAEIVTGAGPGGGPHVKVFSAQNASISERLSFFAYHENFTGGVFVAAGDLDGDGRAEIATGAGPGGGPHVKIFNGLSGAEIVGGFPFPRDETGGVRVGIADTNQNGVNELILFNPTHGTRVLGR